jgi:hypothetical protein
MSVISLPERNEALVDAVSSIWDDFLAPLDDITELAKDRKRRDRVRAALEGFTDEEVWAEVARRRDGAAEEPRSVKQAELEVLTSARSDPGPDRPEARFYAQSLARGAWDAPWTAAVERVVLVHRLREVVAQVGFTRFESASPDIEGELDVGVQRAAISRELTWLPAVETRGEGVFVGFAASAIEAWMQRPAVVERGRELLAGFDAWASEHHGSRRMFPGVPYIMLHSLSHLLITSLALECGYPASSIRERVYAGSGGFGILLFTASSDAEGTLGGLVQAGRQIRHHLRAALDLGRLCSYDPVCAQHEASSVLERRFLHGAACHGCLLISETSCEQHNELLDRALLVPTVAGLGTEFFRP